MEKRLHVPSIDSHASFCLYVKSKTFIYSFCREAQDRLNFQIMGKINDFKNQVKNLPEFSEHNYNIVGYFFAALITIAGFFFIYEVLTTDALTFKANWNMFKSPLGNLCHGIGLICAIAFWGKFGHWTRIPYLVTKDEFGNVEKVERHYDFIETIFWTIMFPFIGHFILEPIAYGAMIYYPIQCIIAVVGAIFPYILSLIVLCIIVGSWMFTRTFQFRYHSAVLVFAGVLFTVAFAWGGYAIGKSEPGSTIQMLTSSTASTTVDNVEAEEDDANLVESDVENVAEGDVETVAEGEEEDDQFAGVGEEGLYGCLPEGVTEFAGEMAGFPIAFSITKSADMGNITAIYRNVKYGTVMNLKGESLPADGGNISFFGKDGNTDWVFNLSGDFDNITGTASCNGKQLPIKLHPGQAPEAKKAVEAPPTPQNPQKGVTKKERVSNEVASPNKGTGFHLEKVNNNKVREEAPRSNQGTGFHLEKVDRVPHQ